MLLKTKADVFSYLSDVKSSLYYRAQEAEDLGNQEGADIIRGIADKMAWTTKRLARELQEQDSSLEQSDAADAFSNLKTALFNCGYEAIEDFLGYEFDQDEDPDTTVNRLDAAYAQMPKEEFEKFVSKYLSEKN